MLLNLLKKRRFKMITKQDIFDQAYENQMAIDDLFTKVASLEKEIKKLTKVMKNEK